MIKRNVQSAFLRLLDNVLSDLMRFFLTVAVGNCMVKIISSVNL
jgi:hypothetical protein